MGRDIDISIESVINLNLLMRKSKSKVVEENLNVSEAKDRVNIDREKNGKETYGQSRKDQESNMPNRCSICDKIICSRY